MAKFGWSVSMVGLTLAAYGIIAAIFQGGLSGVAVARLGEYRVALIGLCVAVMAALGYGLVGTMAGVIVLLVVHGPEGFVHPMLTAIMSKAVPDDAQGELQGGISSVMNIAMLAGTVFFSQVFGYFMQPNAIVQSPDVAFFLAAGFMSVALGLFLVTVRRPLDRAIGVE
jgi:DHA1 family tetracycline resistance protein-like MFS transporter